MKQIVFLFAFFAAFFLVLRPVKCQTPNILYGTGIGYTNGAPNFTPSYKGGRIVVDTVTNYWYEYATPGGWRLTGDRIQTISGCSAPMYTPGKGQSSIVINGCDSLYSFRAGLWRHLNGGGAAVDSSLYVTVSRLADSTAAIRADFPTNTDSQQIEKSGSNDVNLTITGEGGVGSINSITNALVPTNGASGQVLTKGTGASYAWDNHLPSVSISGTSAADESYPLIQVYENDFSVNTTGVSAFNGATITRDAADSTLIVRQSSTAGRGVMITGAGALIEGQTYILQFKLSEASIGVRIREEWADFSDDGDVIRGNGINSVKFKMNVDGGGDEYPIIEVMGPDTVKISDIRIYLANYDYGLVFERKQSIDSINAISSRFDGANDLYRNDFEFDNIGVTAYGAVSLSRANGKLTASGISTGNVLVFAANQFPDTCSYSVTLNIDSLSAPIVLRPVWGNNNADTIYASGVITRRFSRSSVQAISALDGFCINSISAGTSLILNSIEINSITPYQRYFSNDNSVIHGFNARRTGLGFTDASVQIGKNSFNKKANSVTIGVSAQTTDDFIYSAFGGGNEQTAVGELSKSYGWRASAFGSKAHAAAQSSTAVGAGAFSGTTHGVALGRGAILVSTPNSFTNNALSLDADRIFMRNGYAHALPNVPTGLETTGGGATTVNTLETSIYGRCAYDARHDLWSSGTTYASGAFVWHSNVNYVSLQSTTNNTPASSPTYWRSLGTDTGGARGSYNIPAGHIAIKAGLATGSGLSGEVRFYTGYGDNGQNSQDSERLSGLFRSAEAQTQHTQLYLLDTSTNTLYQVKIGASGTGPGGTGRALYID